MSLPSSPTGPHPSGPTHTGRDPSDDLRRVLAALRRRAWQVHGGTALFSFVAVAGLLLLLGAAALGWGAPAFVRPLSIGLVALAAGAAAIFAWRQAGQIGDVALARKLEERDPAAAGLTTAVELDRQLPVAEAQPPERAPFSPALARAHVQTTAHRVAEVGPDRAFDTRPLRRATVAAAGSLGLLALAALWVAPVAPGLARLALGETPTRQPGMAPRATPITGDIALTYLYPAHTGLPPRTVEGTNGTIEAPVGTRVRIETRADRDLARAFLDVDGAALPMEVQGRQLEGLLLVQRTGAYRFRFADERGRDIAVGPDIPITAVVDGAPEIDLLAPVAELTVTETDGVELAFEARDDHGVARVELVFQIGEGEEQVLPVRSFRTPRPRADGTFTWELAGLKLRAGDVITYRLRATDNDEVGGAKHGHSRSQVLKVFSQAEHRRALVARVEEAWESMVLALGDRLTPIAGPRAVRGAQRIDAGAPADELVLQVGNELADVGGELARDEKAPQELTAALANISRNVLEAGRETRSLRVRARAQGDRFIQRLDRAERAEQGELERSVLYLEALLDRQRILEIEELAREMAASRRELTQLMEDYRNSPSAQARQEILQELRRLRERMNELMKRMAELSKGIQDEHLNAEAMKALARERDLSSGVDEIEKLLAEGKIDEALARLQELGMQMEEMAQAISDAADSQAENDPALRELARDLQEYEQQLQELQQAQQELTDATEELRREQAKQIEQRLAREGDSLVQELRERVEQAQKLLEKVPEDELPGWVGDELGGAKERLDDLAGALSVKDFDASLEAAAQALAHSEALESALDRELGYAERFGLRESPGLREARDPVAGATPRVREVKERLEQLFADPSQQMTPGQRRQMQQMAQQQGQLQEQMRELQRQAQKIGQQAPIFDQSAQQAMDGAHQSMGEAGQRLQGHDPGGALAAERQAQEHLQALQQGLEQARQQAQANGGSGFPLPLGGGRGRGESGGRGAFDRQEKVEIPGADQYRAPDEFRKDILDAMKQQAPAGYEDHVRDYYEELVK